MRVKHDFHIHTSLSYCAKKEATFEYYQNIAKELNFEKIGFSDHLWDDAYEQVWPSFYKGQNVARVMRLKDIIHDFDNVKLYLGCEAEYDPLIKGVALTEKNAERFDFINVPISHTHMIMPKEYYEPMEKHKDFMLNAWNEVMNCPVTKYIKAIVHPFSAVCCPYGTAPLFNLITDDEYKFAFDQAAEKGIAIEINMGEFYNRTEQEIPNLPVVRMFRIAKDCGCKFVFGSDSHGVGGHKDYVEHGELVTNMLDITEDDIANYAK